MPPFPHRTDLSVDTLLSQNQSMALQQDRANAQSNMSMSSRLHCGGGSSPLPSDPALLCPHLQVSGVPGAAKSQETRQGGFAQRLTHRQGKCVNITFPFKWLSGRLQLPLFRPAGSIQRSLCSRKASARTTTLKTLSVKFTFFSYASQVGNSSINVS